MGLMGMVFGVSPVLGPVIGGWITDGPGWRWGLWFNLPIGALSMTAIALLHKLPSKKREFRFDWWGALTMALATTSLVLSVTWGGHDYAWTDPVIIGLLLGILVFVVLLIFIELRAADPIIPLTLFKNRNFVLTTGAGLSVGIIMFGSMAYLPTYLQMVHHMSPTRAGLTMISMMGGLIAASITVGNLVAKTGRYKVFPLAGQIITSIALVLMGSLAVDDSLVRVCCYLFAFGIGIGSTMQILVLIVQNSFPLSVVGTATGAKNFFRQVGGAVGAALIGSIFLGNLSHQMSMHLPPAVERVMRLGGDPDQFHVVESSGKLTPAAVSSLPDIIKNAIAVSYNDALTPVFLLIAPISLIAVVLLSLVKEKKLAETIETTVSKP